MDSLNFCVEENYIAGLSIYWTHVFAIYWTLVFEGKVCRIYFRFNVKIVEMTFYKYDCWREIVTFFCLFVFFIFFFVGNCW